MRGYNLPDNVDVNDPEAPWNKEGAEEDKEEKESDISVEDLLAAVNISKRRKEASYEAQEPIIEWIYSDSTYECLGCKRIYHGRLFHSTAGPPTRRYTAWCPKCLDPVVFWLHHQFTVESVEEPQTD